MFPVPAEILSEETKNDDPCNSMHPFPPGWKTPAYHAFAAGKQGASTNGMPMKCNERHTMETKETLQSLDEWSRQELKDILDFYINYDYDPKGGFYGAVLRTLEPVREADRSIVLNARLMWTFASAYRLLKDPRYLEMANHAKDYIKEHFVDKEYGGAYWVVDAHGNPVDESKYPYGIAFIIYGGAELARASGSKDGLKLARDMYEALEKHALDSKHGGYFETFTRDWKRRDDSFNIPDPSLGSKALNTHLHMIESYTTLMLVDDDPKLRKTVGELIDIMTTSCWTRNTSTTNPT